MHLFNQQLVAILAVCQAMLLLCKESSEGSLGKTGQYMAWSLPSWHL